MPPTRWAVVWPRTKRPDAGAVDDRHAAEIDDEVAIAAAEQLLELPLESFGGAAGHEWLHRRHDETVADRRSWHDWAGAGL